MNDQELQRQLEKLAQASPPAGLADRLAAAVPAGTAPVRPLPGLPVRTLITLALLLLAIAVMGFLTGGKGWRGLDFDQRLSLSLMLTMLTAWFAWELSLRMVPAARLYSTGAPAALAALVAAAGWAYWWTPVVANSKLFYFICIGYTTAGVAVSFWLTSRWLRRGFPQFQGFSWSIAGAVGLAGFAGVELFCPYLDVAHIVTSHIMPAVAAGLLAARMATQTKGSS
jgi:hypothetical protein